MGADASRLEEPESKGFLGRVAAGASERVLDLVDPNVVLDHVDVDALLDRVDVNDLLDRVDVNDLLDRVDVDRLLERVNVDALLERADVDALMNRVDMERLVDRAGIPDIVAQSTAHLGGSALDLFRRPLVGLDEIIFRVLNRVIGRDIADFPQGPSDLVHWVDDRTGEPERVTKTGRYAGPLTRLFAVIADGFIIGAGFTIITASIAFVVDFLGGSFDPDATRGLIFAITFALWAFTYVWFSLAVFGKTLGKAVLGVRVVGADGSLLVKPRQAFVRTISYPLSFIAVGVGLLGVVFGKERRAWHDHFASTAVVYDWGSRAAAMPTPLADFLERRSPEE